MQSCTAVKERLLDTETVYMNKKTICNNSYKEKTENVYSSVQLNINHFNCCIFIFGSVTSFWTSGPLKVDILFLKPVCLLFCGSRADTGIYCDICIERKTDNAAK